MEDHKWLETSFLLEILLGIRDVKTEEDEKVKFNVFMLQIVTKLLTESRMYLPTIMVAPIC